MRRPSRATLLVLGTLAALTLLFSRPLVARLAARVSTWRYPAQLALTERFLRAAERGDTVELTRLATNREPVTRMLGLLRTEPGFRAGLGARQLRWASPLQPGPGIAVSYRLPGQVRGMLCDSADGSDQLQVALVPVADEWKLGYAGLEPC
jgi:hypothetical protein